MKFLKKKANSASDAMHARQDLHQADKESLYRLQVENEFYDLLLKTILSHIPCHD